MMERRKVDILCVQETRWKGSKARSIGAGFKLFYYGVDSKRNGVGVVLKEEFARNVLEVKRVSDRVMSLKLEIEGVMLNVVSGYAPQVGCELEEKERFWSELDEVMESIPTGERVVIGADFNGHVGEGNTGDEEVMGKFGVKERNLEDQMVVDFAKRMDMAVVNTYFQKREEHRVTYKSGGRKTQIDYILRRRGNLKEISDCKVVVGESVARQHRMVVCRMTLMVCKMKRSKLEIEKKTKWGKLKKEVCCEEFRQKLRQALGGQVVLPDDWKTTAEVIRETGRKVLGVSSGRRKEDKETWWWNEEVQDSIQRNRLAKKKWDMDRTEENRQEFKELQRRVKREVSKAKQKAYDELYTRLDTREGEEDLYRLARQRDRDGKDVQQVRVIKDRDGRVLTSEESVQRRWKEYFEELMNEENEREKRVEGVNSVEQKVDKIRKDEVRKALKRMKSGKAVGPDDIPVESHFSYFDKTTDMCLKPISVVTSYRRRHFHPRSRGHVSRNLIYPPLLSQSQTVVVGGLWNCQSAIRKADFISALASHYSFDFLALTETWIPPQNTATPAALSSAYTFSHSPRESGRGGGTGLLLSQRWCTSPLPLSHLTISSFEFHAVSVTSPINLFIIVIYRPPGPLGNFLDEMDTLLSVFPSDSTPLTVLGDFNLPSDKLHSSGLLALLNSFSLSFNSCPPTHKESNILDLVFTHPSPATDMTVTPLHISDHHLVSFSITLPVLPKRNPQHLSLTRRNLHSISPSSVASCTLSSLPDHESFSSLPLDSATDTLLSSLSSTMDFLCPLSTIRRKNSSPAPWLSDVLRNNRRELRSAARKWKKSKLDTDLTSYRTLLSKFSLDVTSAKTSFYKEKLETSAQDPRKLHNIFSSLLNPPAPPSPSSLTAEDFASFYTEKIERICQTFTSLPTSPTSHNQHSATPSLTQLSTVAAEEVLQITRSCNPTTCPLDPIPSAMLQTISPDLLPFITTVINGSLTSGHVPTAFKKARVIPILKKPALDPSDISNYRPVSLLSFLSKILERVVCNQLSDYLMQNNLHDPNQSGFKAAHSTETALLAVTEKLHAARSAKLSSVLILLDLSAAFDTVNHKTLLSTLRSLGICGTAWEWFASYLDGRSYQVTWKGLTSAPRRLSTGVPQGSVLGPLLFSLYTHSLGKVISSHGFSYHCYADDTQLIFSFPPSDTTASARISACLADISSWMTAHQLKLNPSKTELLIIPGDPSPAQDLVISLSNSMISPTASARNLGVTMDNQLSFSSHVTNVTRSCRFLLYNIRRIRPFLSTQATQVLVQLDLWSSRDWTTATLFWQVYL
ncbi:hypothetical protein QTP86_029866 [Hemibagrus guttatus]|nr:hypothetical protein QTP86_029866 [Hemibagrus guttatus]